MKKNNSQKIKEQVLVAMSGGIDSSYCVHLLQKKGFEVIGIYLNNLDSKADKNNWNNVKKIADFFGVKIYKLTAQKTFTTRVIQPFIEAYANGLTPNPCILCNRVFKFKELLALADKLKIKKVATGHYAKLKTVGKFVYLSPAKDQQKDQIYFLYQLPQNYLKRLVLPLGNLEKSQIKLAVAKILPTELLPQGESQEICFVPQDDLSGFLEKTLKKRPGGKIIDAKTVAELGKYEPKQFFTVGQRKGLGLPGGPWYVSRFDAKKNQVYILNEKDKQALEVSELKFKKILWSGATPTFPVKIKYKLRSAQKWTNGILRKDKQGFVLKLAPGQLAPSPGQSAAFLAGGKLIGGAVIV
jgi:tRNA-specific 2-thiouridylase